MQTAGVNVTSNQLPLFGGEVPRHEVRPKYERRQDNATADIPTRAALRTHRRPRKEKVPLDEAAAIFIKQHPATWAMFCKFAWQIANAGHKKIGVALIYERMRWETMLEGKDADGYKLNNNYRAYFARRFMLENPSAGELFSTRKVNENN